MSNSITIPVDKEFKDACNKLKNQLEDFQVGTIIQLINYLQHDLLISLNAELYNRNIAWIKNHIIIEVE